MAAMFLAMVCDARRRQEALAYGRTAGRAARLVARAAGTVLSTTRHTSCGRTVTIARGHLEVLRRTNGGATMELDVALDELKRIEQILERLLLLARTTSRLRRPRGRRPAVFSRTCSCAGPKSPHGTWRLGELAAGSWSSIRRLSLGARRDCSRNAVKYTEWGDVVEARVHPSRARTSRSRSVTAAAVFTGTPSPHIFEPVRARGRSRTRSRGGVGLGLAIRRRDRQSTPWTLHRGERRRAERSSLCAYPGFSRGARAGREILRNS